MFLSKTHVPRVSHPTHSFIPQLSKRALVRCRADVLLIGKETVKTLNESDILPDFLTAYSSLCNSIPFEKCHSMMVIPPVSEQLAVLQVLDTLSSITDIQPISGLLTYLLSVHDKDNFEMVVNAVIQMNHYKEVIQMFYQNVIS